LNQLGFHVSIVYSIGAVIHPENKKLLKLIKNYFNEEGSINTCKNLYLYEVSSIKEYILLKIKDI